MEKQLGICENCKTQKPLNVDSHLCDKCLHINSKEIIGFLFLYAGAKVLIDSGEFRIKNGTGILRGTDGRRVIVEYEGELLKIEFVDVDVPLRPFISMTDQECLEFAQLVGGASHLPEEGQIHSSRELLSRFYNMQTNITGGRWAHAIKYLFEKGFDVFDLHSKKTGQFLESQKENK